MSTALPSLYQEHKTSNKTSNHATYCFINSSSLLNISPFTCSVVPEPPRSKARPLGFILTGSSSLRRQITEYMRNKLNTNRRTNSRPSQSLYNKTVNLKIDKYKLSSLVNRWHKSRLDRRLSGRLREIHLHKSNDRRRRRRTVKIKRMEFTS